MLIYHLQTQRECLNDDLSPPCIHRELFSVLNCVNRWGELATFSFVSRWPPPCRSLRLVQLYHDKPNKVPLVPVNPLAGLPRAQLKRTQVFQEFLSTKNTWRRKLVNTVVVLRRDAFVPPPPRWQILWKRAAANGCPRPVVYTLLPNWPNVAWANRSVEPVPWSQARDSPLPAVMVIFV